MDLRTKIICTIGPSVSAYEEMLALIKAGMNVARLNFSHGEYAEHKKNIENLKKARAELKIPLAIMLDTQGPEIRIGKVKNDALSVAKKQKLKLTLKEEGEDAILLPDPAIFNLLKPKTKVLFDDGYINAEVIETHSDHVWIEFQNQGGLKSGKKMNIPGIELPLPAMSQKDIDDLKFGCELDVDII